ncbi:hypothetical protein HYS48_02750 [Candidatus Woesearchaeota archaeon]|nr:hypothetical protein [Candidatus Woesearchaeota archaeon]
MIHEDEFQYVFPSPDEVRATGAEGLEVLVNGHVHFVSENGQYDQETVLAELMYRNAFLFAGRADPSLFRINRTGEFVVDDGTPHKQKIPQMPNVYAFIEALNQQLGYSIGRTRETMERMQEVFK